MDMIEQQLEQAFLKLPTLKHVGMALMQFTFAISTTSVRKDASGIFHLQIVSFGFPEGEERIRMRVNVGTKKIDAMDKRWLPLQPDQGFGVCEIKRASQLGQAVRYIQNAYDHYLETRQVPSDSTRLN